MALFVEAQVLKHAEIQQQKGDTCGLQSTIAFFSLFAFGREQYNIEYTDVPKFYLLAELPFT